MRTTTLVLAVALIGCGDQAESRKSVEDSNVQNPDVTNPIDPNAPTAANDLATVTEGGEIDLDLVANDLAGTNGLDLSSVTIQSGPTYGTLSVNADGTATYTHDGSESSVDWFTYVIADADGLQSNEATVSVEVTPVNDAPVASDDTITIPEGGAASIDIAGNDTDADDGINVAAIKIVDQPTSGIVVVQSNGTVDYYHDGSEVTSDSFTYSIQDASGETSELATVSIVITPENDRPTAYDDYEVVAEGGTIVIDPTGNDTDPDDGIDPSSLVITHLPTQGIIVVNSLGLIEYTHFGEDGGTDTIGYTVSDHTGATSATATVGITVTPVNDPPVGNPDDFTIDEGGFVGVDLLANDTDPDDGIDPSSLRIERQPANGTVLVSNGSITYSHDGSETHTDGFAYSVADHSGARTGTITVNVTVDPKNDAPVTVPDTAEVQEGEAVAIALLSNDSDPDGSLIPANVVITSQPANGTLTDRGDGTFVYLHDGSETLADQFTYTLSDKDGATSTPTPVTITVSSKNDAPEAHPDQATVEEGRQTFVDVAANDEDAEGGLNPASITVINPPQHGSVAIAGGVVEYVHDGSESTQDTFTYTIQDLEGASSAPATVSVEVNPVNDPPTTATDFVAVDEGSYQVFAPLANDTDSDDGIDFATVVVTKGPSNGAVEVYGDGTIGYTHDGSDTTSDTFEYTVADFTGARSGATVNVTVNPINDLPVANDDVAGAAEGGSGLVNLLGNDSDVDGTLVATSIAIVGPASHGTVMLNGDGTAVYTHDGSETTTDSFVYVVYDDQGALSNPATVNLTISPVNDAPVAIADTAAVDNAGTTNIAVVANDVDADSTVDATTVSITTIPAYGTITVQPDGSIDYTHDGSATLADSFSYTVADNEGKTSNQAVVTVEIAPKPCPTQEIFAFTGAVETFTVPEGCIGTLSLEVFGAQGAGGNGGLGGYAAGDLQVTGGEVLNLFVGGTDGFNGGGFGWAIDARNGGGASDIRLGGTHIGDRILVAGGGGGSAGDANFAGGDGGGGECGANYCGGAAGLGIDSFDGFNGGVAGGAGATAAHAGGAGGGGRTSGGLGSCNTDFGGTCGDNGTLGFGGAGDTWESGTCYTSANGTAGGGGGFYGGGGSSVGACGGGGAGGGSSWTGTLSNPLLTAGVRSGDGEIVLTFSQVAFEGSFRIGDGPSYTTNPQVYSCVEACAEVFGGEASEYQCSTSDTSIDNQAYVSGWGDGQFCATPVAEDFSMDQGSGYNCGSEGCSYSAFVSDHCATSVNYCWR